MSESVTVKVWMPGNTSVPPQELFDKSQEWLAANFYLTNNDMSGVDWSHIGNAELTIELLPVDGMIEKKLEALKEARKRLIADHMLKLGNLDGQIHNLLAITYVPEE